MMTIWKAPLNLGHVTEVATGMQPGVDVIDWSGPTATVGLDPQGVPSVWFLAETDPIGPYPPRRFDVIGTGNPVYPGQLKMIGTIIGGPFAWHVVELLP